MVQIDDSEEILHFELEDESEMSQISIQEDQEAQLQYYPNPTELLNDQQAP